MKYSMEFVKRAAELAHQGLNTRQIEAKIGVATITLSAWAQKYPDLFPKFRGQHIKPELLASFAELRRQGFTHRGIATKLGVSASAVKKYAMRCTEDVSHPDSDDPHAWHYKRGTRFGKCRLCGCPDHKGRRTVHRRRLEDGRYEKRLRSEVGWKRVAITGYGDPNPEIKMAIRQIQELRAQGVVWDEVAEAVGRSTNMIATWSRRYSDVWKAEAKRARAKYAGQRRNLSRRRRDLEAKMRIAAAMRVRGASWREIAEHFGLQVESVYQWKYKRIERWNEFYGAAKEQADREPRPEPKPQPVIDPVSKGGELTLVTFYWQHFHPMRHKGRAKKATIQRYDQILRCWHESTGDPPLALITDEMLGEHLAHLAASRNGVTVNIHRAHLLSILYFAGPRGHRARNARGILLNPPYVEKWPEYRRIPRTIPMEHARRIFDACQYATLPHEKALGAHESARLWWERLLILLGNTGMRISEALTVGDAQTDWNSGQLLVLAENAKTKRERIVHLNRHALAAIEPVRGSNPFFPWGHHRCSLHTHFRRLQRKVGLQSPSYGFHDIRRTVATGIAELGSPELGQLQLGHTTFNMTHRAYIGKAKLAGLLESLPQPFTSETEGGAA